MMSNYMTVKELRDKLNNFHENLDHWVLEISGELFENDNEPFMLIEKDDEFAIKTVYPFSEIFMDNDEVLDD